MARHVDHVPADVGPQPATAVAPQRPGGRFRDVGADATGASAVEFALVAAPFLAILFAILELAFIFIVNVSLSVATAGFATKLRTGQLLAPGLAATASTGSQIDLADAKTKLCNQMPILNLATCVQQLQIDVRPLTSFAQSASATPVSGSTFTSTNLCYYSGDAGDVVEIRTWYLYAISDLLLLAAFSSVKTYIVSAGVTLSGYFYPITATEVFKSENYSGGTNTGAGC